MTKRALIVMAKRPVPGATKTRLCPPLSPQTAALLYEACLKDTLDVARSVAGATRHIAVTPPCHETYFARLAPDFSYLPQEGSHLSERLDAVLTACSNAGFDQVVAINSDSPTLPGHFVRQAFALLDGKDVDVVFGPADDGGYYLIGWKKPNGRLVRQVTMSTPHVLRDSLRIAEEEGLGVALVPAWYDVDDAGDLPRLSSDLLAMPGRGKHTRRILNELLPNAVSWVESSI